MLVVPMSWIVLFLQYFFEVHTPCVVLSIAVVGVISLIAVCGFDLDCQTPLILGLGPGLSASVQ